MQHFYVEAGIRAIFYFKANATNKELPKNRANLYRKINNINAIAAVAAAAAAASNADGNDEEGTTSHA